MWRQPLARLVDHARIGVDAAQRAAVGRDGARGRAVTRAHVEHVIEPQQRRDADRKRLPAAPGRVEPFQLVRSVLGKTVAPFDFQLAEPPAAPPA